LWRQALPTAAGTARPDDNTPADTPQATAHARRHTLLMAWWVAAILLFFSLPTSKLVGYILPALAPWCALLAAALTGRPAAGPADTPSRWLPLPGRVALALAATLCVGAVVTLAWQAPKSNRDIGLALRAQAAPGDRLVLVDNPYQDLLFYARLPQPALVASRWDDPQIARQDNWRKELADAARFDPARAAQVLYPIGALPAVVCHGQRVWLVAGDDQASRLAGVPGARLVLQGRHAQLWRAEPQACAAGG
jgi:4-amino-4-deoxy-L-arabinose transferase-like glycosyltransferase